jgi:hypothetical protein
MKMLISFVAVFLFGMSAAMADSLRELPIPSEVTPLGQPGQIYCVGNSFGAGGAVNGACQTRVSQACSGRGCNPAQTITVFVATWDAEGNALSAVACESVRHHLPQKDVVTYLNGYTSCPSTGIGTGTTVVIDGVPLYYVATDPTTGAELVNENYGGFLYLP